jgi:predicted adenine nucleotide alpha hydrolase (AANH) superfamily ATPase
MKKFLLHTCCAPCSIAVIDELKDQYDLTVFFYNPNIYPEEEYLKRKKEVVKICQEWEIKMVDLETTKISTVFSLEREEISKIDYDQKEWNYGIKGLENESEGGARCSKCFLFRLEKTAKYAKEFGFDIFCTTLTSGRNKKAEIINSIGRSLSKKYGIEFLEADWKKDKQFTPAKITVDKQESRQEKATRLIKERGIYRQKYCGCKFSLPKIYFDQNKT